MSEFAGKLNEILNYGALNLAIAIGYKNRIFDILEDLNKPVTIKEIASASKLNARYLKEWLGVMVSGKIIEISTNPNEEDIYLLPSEHALYLTRKSESNNRGVYTQELPLLTACAMESVNEGFKTGEGVPFSKYPDFQQFMAETSDAKHKKVLINDFLPSVENGQLLNCLHEGIKVCDLGCGQGVALNLMAETFPNSIFTGIDNHEAAIIEARKAAQEMNLSNANYLVLDAAKIIQKEEFFGLFNYICAFDAIHDQSHPLEVLKGIRAMLVPGGMFSMVDIKAGSNQTDNIDHPLAPFLYAVSLMHCMPVGLNNNGTGLGMMWGQEKAESLLKKAGFEQVEIIEMERDPFNLHYFCKIPSFLSVEFTVP